MSEQETPYNFMTIVETLPQRSTNTDKPLRLFGFNFPKETTTSTGAQTKYDNCSTSIANTSQTSTQTAARTKFECHYCCRIFPTSQALGGHQNAHKRERQQAKRAQFQTSMSVEGHMYSPFAFYRVPYVPSSARFESPPVTSHYSSRVNANATLRHGASVYNGSASVSYPLNGNRASSMCRFPLRQDRPMVLPLLGGADPKFVVGSSSDDHNNSNDLKEKGLNDPISLDLHL